MDVQRMWLRNLGRDDRIISDTGREARHPFLDTEFQVWARSYVHVRKVHTPSLLQAACWTAASLLCLAMSEGADRL